MIARSTFLAGLAGAVLTPAVRAQEEYDPEVNAPVQTLRVLLGQGTAQPVNGGGFTFNGRPYRGTFSHLPDGSVINVVSLEDYLYSVVPREMSPSWPAAALQAQAICARTYVLQRSTPSRAYDVTPSESDQVYTGMLGESPGGRAAVDATAGQVMRFGGEFASIMYSSCCGGHTESPAYAWQGGAQLPYLNGVVCPYCTASPNYRWQHDIAISDVQRAFSRELATVGTITGARITAADPSGRAVRIAFSGDTGTAEIKGGALRTGLGTRTVPSLLIARIDIVSSPSPEAGGNVHIEGAGLGHGVGLCQWGARGMALAGKPARDIIAFYFPGTDIGHD